METQKREVRSDEEVAMALVEFHPRFILDGGIQVARELYKELRRLPSTSPAVLEELERLSHSEAWPVVEGIFNDPPD